MKLFYGLHASGYEDCAPEQKGLFGFNVGLLSVSGRGDRGC